MMKKLMIIPAIVTSMMSAATMASVGDIKFTGLVAQNTCNLTPNVDGNMTDVIALGTVAPQKEGQVVSFVLKPSLANDTTNCESVFKDKAATVTWSASFNQMGIENVGGVAKDALVILAPINASENKNITSTNSTVSFAKNKLITEGLKFEAKLKGGHTVGDFRTTASYIVTYS